jgi:O-antigen ligase
LVLGIVQYFGHFTLDPVATREALLKLATNIVFFFLAGQLFSSTSLFPNTRSASPFPKTRFRVSRPESLVPIYTFAIALFAIFQFLSGPTLLYGTVRTEGWPFGPYVNHNHYAGLMEMLIPLTAAGVLLAIFRHTSVSLFGIFVLIPMASLFLSGSRGGLISLAVEALMAALLICFCGHVQRGKKPAWLGGLVVATATLLFVWMAPPRIVHRMATMADEEDSPEAALAERWVAGRDALRIFRAHPWVGIGMGGFETVFPQYQSFSSDLTWDHAHNDYTELLAETGVAGGTLALLALGSFFWLAFRHLRRKLAHRVGWIPFGASLGCCGLLVHSLVDFNLHIPANAAWFAACAAIATGEP